VGPQFRHPTNEEKMSIQANNRKKLSIFGPLIAAAGARTFDLRSKMIFLRYAITTDSPAVFLFADSGPVIGR